MKLGLVRTALFVPGNRPERVDKAVASGADAVIIDLEDAVPLAEKESARPKVREKILQYADRTIIVRVNALGSGLLQRDLVELIGPGLHCIMLPKVESPADMQEINGILLCLERERGIQDGTISIIPLIESARGVQNIHQIVSERTDPPRIFTVAFGAADYTLDLGIEMTTNGMELAYARSIIPIACRAADVAPPLDTPFMINLNDREGLEADARRAKQLGFQGKLCIHPNQIALCNAVFSPTQDEIDYARRLVDAFSEAEAKGLGAIQLDGKFIDYPVVERARRIVKLGTIVEQQ